MNVPAGALLMDGQQMMQPLDGAIKIMRLDSEGDEMLLYFLESDSCALSMGSYMGRPKAASELSPSATHHW